MKNLNLVLVLIIFMPFGIFAQQDADGCKEHPAFPTRMSNYIIAECINNFDAVEFPISDDGSQTVTKEGNKTSIRYDFNVESGKQKPSVLQILRNYENAAKKIGGTTMFLNTDAAVGVFKIIKAGKEISWVKVECGGDNSNDFYILYILELEAMEQEITSTDMLTALNTDGHIALYINFDFGKATVQTESKKIVDQIAEMLSANPSLKISIEGHTDNVGSAASNKTLSENRAKAAMDALIAQGVDKSRLMAKGWGLEKPVSDNSTEEGRAKNRRVEIVKL